MSDWHNGIEIFWLCTEPEDTYQTIDFQLDLLICDLTTRKCCLIGVHVSYLCQFVLLHASVQENLTQRHMRIIYTVYARIGSCLCRGFEKVCVHGEIECGKTDDLTF